MTQPLALVLYEKLLPGSQLVNRLQDLNYRVQTVNDPAMLVDCAQQTKPIVVLADLDSTQSDVRAAIARLRQTSATRHLPVIAFGSDPPADDRATDKGVGITLLVSEGAILSHLAECLEQALHID